MTRFLFIRHGETDWNREGRWQGQADVPLNAVGLAQAARLAEELYNTAHLDAIYASDLKRAYQTAEALAAVYGLPIHLDPRLREIHQGEWQGLLVTEIEARYERIFHLRRQDPWSMAPPGGETAADVRKRVVEALAELAARHPYETVAIVAHGFVLAVARAVNAGAAAEDIWKLVPENCTPIFIDWAPA